MKKRRPEHQDELVLPGAGTRIPIPENVTDDDIDELVITHPDIVARAERDRRERTGAQTVNTPTVDGQVPRERVRGKTRSR